MCGRYALMSSVELLADLFQLTSPPALRRRYNIAPAQEAPVVRVRGEEEPGRRLELMRWGFVPPWTKDPVLGGGLINARAETAAEKPAFRGAFRRRRCLVPADAFYEWKKCGEGKQPFAVRRRDGRPFAMAGLYTWWQPPEAAEAPAVAGFAILTTAASALLRPVHDRMPLILDPEQFEAWLDPQRGDPADLLSRLDSHQAAELTLHPVSRRVNSPKNDDAGCLEPVETAGGGDSPERGLFDTIDD